MKAKKYEYGVTLDWRGDPSKPLSADYPTIEAARQSLNAQALPATMWRRMIDGGEWEIVKRRDPKW